MTPRSQRYTAPGPRGPAAARCLAGFARRPLGTYMDLFTRYGDTVQVPFPPRRNLFILSRPEQAEHVLATNQDNYVKAFTYRPLRALIGDGLLTSEGETWRRHRRIIQPVFSRRHIAGFAPQMTAGAARALARWDALPAGAVVDAAAEMSALTLDVVGQVLLRFDLRENTAPLGRALAAGQRLTVLGTFLPLPWGARSTRAVRAVLARWPGGPVATLERPVSRVLAGRRSAAPTGGSPDLLDLLMAARDAGGGGLTDAEIRDEVATFMLAGHETTANALAWSLALLSAYPSARERLEEEADSGLGEGETGAGVIERLPWTQAVVSEAMRLYPPAWTIERDALGDDDVCGVAIPARSTVAVPPYLIHRNPGTWRDPAGFDPRRFLPDAAQDRHRYAYIPFGGGRRGCVGVGFAQLEAVLVLATLCRRYRLDLAGAGLPRPDAKVTLRPRRGLPMRLTRRT
ncbi:MAG: cytochrome P450 [Micromonosporaceae bacterium]